MKVDDKQFLKRLTEYERRVRDAQFDAMNDNRLDLELQATLLAPLDEGTLQSSKVSTKPKWRGDILESKVGFNEPYATKVHETMKPAIRAKGIQMERGKWTKRKPPTKYGIAGGKYLERPMLFGRDEYMKHIANTVKAVK